MRYDEGVKRSWILAITLAVAACSLAFDLPGTGGSPSNDAGLDARVATEAGIEASTTAEAGARFCVPGAHTFCDDFDGPGALGDGWSNVDKTSGTLELSTSTFLSAPRALTATLPRRPQGAPADQATLVKQINGPWKHTVIECDVLVDPTTWQSSDINSGAFALTLFGENGSATFTLSIAETYSSLNGPPQPGTGPAVPTGTWQHWKIDLQLDGTITATLGTIVLSAKGQLPAPTAGGSGTILELGVLGYNAPAPAFGFHFDNVTIDLL